MKNLFTLFAFILLNASLLITPTGASAQSWVNEGSAGFSAGQADYTSMAIDGSGTPYVVYAEWFNSAKATVMKYNGSSWVNVGTAGFSAGAADNTSIAIDGSGTPYVVYKDKGKCTKATEM
jgi:ABC-type phosphate transport system substrate-binding protein